MGIDQLTSLKLFVQRAMLGEVTGNLACVTVGLEGTCVTLQAYFFEEPREDDRERVEVVATEVIADFPAGYSPLNLSTGDSVWQNGGTHQARPTFLTVGAESRF